MGILRTRKHALAQDRQRVPSFKAYLRMGGIVGMVRGIISGWERPFTVNQVKIAFHYRFPALNPGDFQIDDILSLMVKRGYLERSEDGSFQKAVRKPVLRIVIRAIRGQQMSFINL